MKLELALGITSSTFLRNSLFASKTFDRSSAVNFGADCVALSSVSFSLALTSRSPFRCRPTERRFFAGRRALLHKSGCRDDLSQVFGRQAAFGTSFGRFEADRLQRAGHLARGEPTSSANLNVLPVRGTTWTSVPTRALSRSALSPS